MRGIPSPIQPQVFLSLFLGVTSHGKGLIADPPTPIKLRIKQALLSLREPEPAVIGVHTCFCWSI